MMNHWNGLSIKPSSRHYPLFTLMLFVHLFSWDTQAQGRFGGGNGSGYFQMQASGITTSTSNLAVEPNDWVAFPQPASTTLNLKGPITSNAQVALYDWKGRLLVEKPLSNYQLILPNGLRGLYILECQGKRKPILLGE